MLTLYLIQRMLHMDHLISSLQKLCGVRTSLNPALSDSKAYILNNTLSQELANFFFKGPDSNCFWLYRPVSVSATQLCCYNAEAAIDNKQMGLIVF